MIPLEDDGAYVAARCDAEVVLLQPWRRRQERPPGSATPRSERDARLMPLSREAKGRLTADLRLDPDETCVIAVGLH